MTKKLILYLTILLLHLFVGIGRVPAHENDSSFSWPSGQEMSPWFTAMGKIDPASLGPRYVVTDYGITSDSTILQTRQLQSVIDTAYAHGGGLVVIPSGTYLSGSLFFRQGVNLYLSQGARLKGSNRIRDFRLMKTRMEGQTLNYFAALINADSISGFTICGPGTIDGNGHDYWEEFWIRRQYNPQCTNLEAMRPRLIYISHSTDVTIQDVRLINSPFWTNHLYRCQRVRYLDCQIYAPTEGLKAPSSDAIDIDACSDVVVRGCYINVNDDAVVLKGGKGTWADQNPDNDENTRILIEDCHYGKVHGCLTLGSESIHDRDIILRHCQTDNADRVLWLKMRPDTPQHYEHILVEDIQGQCGSFLVIHPWTQFHSPQERPDMPPTTCHDITIRNINVQSTTFYDVIESHDYTLYNIFLTP